MIIRFSTMLLALVVCCAMVSFASEGQRSASQLFTGMAKTEVLSMMGPPERIRSVESREAWLYCVGYRGYRDDLVTHTIWFRNGRLSAVGTLSHAESVTCEDYINMFRWEDEIPANRHGMK